MSKKLNMKMIQFVKTLIDVIYGLLIFASVSLVILILLTPILLKTSDLVLTASVPVAIGTGDSPQFDVQVAGAMTKGIRAAFVDDTQGTLRLETSNPSFVIVSYSAKLLTVIGLDYIFYLLRTVLQAILNQLTFIEPALSLPKPFKVEVILASLLILILAQVWSYGLELEREQALTI